MRIVFIGAVEFSKHCLREVLECGGNVVGVFTLDREHAAFHSDYALLSDVGDLYGTTTYLVEKINAPESVQQIQSLEPDVIFVFGWSQLVSRQILDIPRLGCIGTHPALLPRNRGRHPIVWTLVEGLTESGLTFFYMDEHADSGDILWQRGFPVSLEDDAGSVYAKIEQLASEAIREFLPQLERGTAPRVPQNHDEATYWRRRTTSDGEVHWEAPTMTTYNLIRALAKPYVGAHACLDGKKLRIWRATLPADPLPSEARHLTAGSVFGHNDQGFHVRTGDGYLVIARHDLVDAERLGLETGSGHVG